MLNLINLLAGGAINTAQDFCNSAQPILRLVGWVYIGIEIVVPILLIIMGMLDLAKAVAEKSDDKIKAAQQLLIKRAIAAAIVFLVAAAVGLLMRVVGSDAYSKCTKCVFTPWRCEAETIEVE